MSFRDLTSRIQSPVAMALEQEDKDGEREASGTSAWPPGTSTANLGSTLATGIQVTIPTDYKRVDSEAPRHFCRHCQVKFGDQARLKAHLIRCLQTASGTLETRNTVSSADSHEFNNAACTRCEAYGHNSVTCVEVVKCRRCRESRHTTRRCDNCRSDSGCFICDNENHESRDCIFRHAFGENGPNIPTDLLAAFPKSSEIYREMLMAGRVDLEALRRQDEKLAQKLKSGCNVPLAGLNDADISSATKALIFASWNKTTRLSVTSPPKRTPVALRPTTKLSAVPTYTTENASSRGEANTRLDDRRQVHATTEDASAQRMHNSGSQNHGKIRVTCSSGRTGTRS